MEAFSWLRCADLQDSWQEANGSDLASLVFRDRGEGAGAAISQHLVFHGRFCDLQGPPFFSIDATNENDETLHVKTCYSAWEKQDAAWIKGQLKETLANVTHLAGLSQDTAAVCKAAFKQLQGELGPDQPRCFYIDCNEHVSQLLAQDLARALPWMKD